MSRIEGDITRNTGLDTSIAKKEKAQKQISSAVNEELATQENNGQAYKVELSSVAKNINSNSNENIKDMAKKIEEIKAKIANGSYEIDTNKIVEGLLKYF
ncbi:MAG: flagellar biosynthesis anti-sigma factor FlgM [Hydrogenobaculum sp.]|nr:MAG: flagellar biosynthesis anti-sigma factor FlgM [Hydrogenobaculum sp.]HEK25176.1 flagellar biosynthesis anti-sigma factor FlgM [Hydrogenobaculum sp.]